MTSADSDRETAPDQRAIRDDAPPKKPFVPPHVTSLGPFTRVTTQFIGGFTP